MLDITTKGSVTIRTTEDAYQVLADGVSLTIPIPTRPCFNPLPFEPGIQVAREAVAREARDVFKREVLRFMAAQGMRNRDLARRISRSCKRTWDWTAGEKIPARRDDVAAIAAALEIPRKYLEFLWLRARKPRVMKKGLCRCRPRFSPGGPGAITVMAASEGLLVDDAHGKMLISRDGVPVPILYRPPENESPDIVRWLVRLYLSKHQVLLGEMALAMRRTGIEVSPREIKMVERRRLERWSEPATKVAQALGVFRLAA